MKQKTFYQCQECGHNSAKWLGKCPDCQNWNSFVEEIEINTKNSKHLMLKTKSEICNINEISENNFKRINTNISEFDKVLGGGIVEGSMVLLGGAPGIGKSTLMLQVASNLSKNLKVLYVSGEESLGQIKLRANRLNILSKDLFLLSETNIDLIFQNIEQINPKIVIIDSIQTLYKDEFQSAPGSVSQIRQSATELLNIAKQKNISFFILGHITKDGAIAGPRVLEHIVDTVLYFETEMQQLHRILRSYKNRFGPSNEIAIFEMTAKGLISVENPSLIFLSEHSNTAGSLITSCMQGTRAILIEIQSLVTYTNFGLPRRMSAGYDINKIILLVAVLEKRLGLNLSNQDIFVNLAGGIKIKETSIDLSVACSIALSFRNIITQKQTIVLGEVGLGGEVRTISQIEERLKEAKRLGFKKAIIPKSNLKNLKIDMEIIAVDNLKSAIDALR